VEYSRQSIQRGGRSGRIGMSTSWPGPGTGPGSDLRTLRCRDKEDRELKRSNPWVAFCMESVAKSSFWAWWLHLAGGQGRVLWWTLSQAHGILRSPRPHRDVLDMDGEHAMVLPCPPRPGMPGDYSGGLGERSMQSPGGAAWASGNPGRPLGNHQRAEGGRPSPPPR
jgi:hypothetical protein